MIEISEVTGKYRQRSEKKSKSHHVIELQVVQPHHKTPKIKNLLWYREAMEEERARSWEGSLRMEGSSFSLWKADEGETLGGNSDWWFFHEPAHLKHISLERWHHHFISCSKSLTCSKNKFEARAKGRKQKKAALTTKWWCEQVHRAVAQGSYPDRSSKPCGWGLCVSFFP